MDPFCLIRCDSGGSQEKRVIVLKLRRIELCGFKSFYDRSEIHVGDAGVIAVVGPNGCGKSNISDAVAWVLGEQKARSLRGDRMEDVIFSGTGKRSQLGMAEVTISLVEDAPAHTASHHAHGSRRCHRGRGRALPVLVAERPQRRPRARDEPERHGVRDAVRDRVGHPTSIRDDDR